MSARRQFGMVAVAAVLATCCLSSCTGSHPVAPARHARAHGAGPRSALTLQVMPAPYQLPAAVSREVVLPAAGGLLIIGGLTRSGASAMTVTSLDPVTGGTRAAGRLAQATHDAAGLVPGRAGVRARRRDGEQRAHRPGVHPGDARHGDRGDEPGPFGFRRRIGGTGRLRDRGLRRHPAGPGGARDQGRAALPGGGAAAGAGAVRRDGRGQRPDLGVRRPDGGGPDGRHPADRPGHRRGHRGRPPAAAGPGRGRDQPGRAGLRRGRGPGPAGRAPVRPGHVPGERGGRAAGAGRLRGARR